MEVRDVVRVVRFMGFTPSLSGQLPDSDGDHRLDYSGDYTLVL
jgi:hypothetical protein